MGPGLFLYEFLNLAIGPPECGIEIPPNHRAVTVVSPVEEFKIRDDGKCYACGKNRETITLPNEGFYGPINRWGLPARTYTHESWRMSLKEAVDALVQTGVGRFEAFPMRGYLVVRPTYNEFYPVYRSGIDSLIKGHWQLHADLSFGEWDDNLSAMNRLGFEAKELDGDEWRKKFYIRRVRSTEMVNVPEGYQF